MNILITHEMSGRVRDAFIAQGHNAVSCDLLPSESNKGPHRTGNVWEFIEDGSRWDCIISFPDCTNLCVSGLHWNKRRPERAALTESALLEVRSLLGLNCRFLALENPVGCISTRIRKPTQIIQPYEYGDDASKKTCLWLKGLPPLIPNPSDYVYPRLVDVPGKPYLQPRWANQTDSGQNKLGPSPTRAMDRARTYPGIAKSMATQWGAFLNTVK